MPAAKSKTSAIHFLTGSDEAAVKKAASALAQELAPGADAFGLETIDGAVDTVDAAAAAVHDTIQALLTLPFMGGAKLVWLKSASFFADNTAGRSETVQEAIAELVALLGKGLPESVTFLLSAPQADKRRTAYKSLSKLAATAVHDLPDLGFRAGDEEIVEWTSGLVRERDIQLTPDAVETLAARVGFDPRQLDNELEKLDIAFGKSRSVDSRDIREMVPQTREGGIFDLGDAIGKRDLPLALETLAMLFRQGERGVGILLAAIVPTVRNLLLAKDLLARHKLPPPSQAHFFAGTLKKLPEHAIAHLPRKKDGTINAYPLGLAAMNSTRYTLDELAAGFRACAETNQTLLSGTLTEEIILARFLISLMAKKIEENALT